MIELSIVSLIWAFSFSIIKGKLQGIDSSLLGFLRLSISAIVFLPFLQFSGLKFFDFIKLAFVGAVQFGIMYIFYLRSFAYLSAYEVAIFTVTTPILVSLFFDLFNLSINKKALISALLAAIGALVISMKSFQFSGAFKGFLYVQISNACFALGQVVYAKFCKTSLKEQHVFSFAYIAAVIATLIMAAPKLSGIFHIGLTQWAYIFYLGAISSGLCFFLWNKGAGKVSQGFLAVMNNVKIPLGVLVALLIFGEQANILRLSIGGGLMAFGLLLNYKK